MTSNISSRAPITFLEAAAFTATLAVALIICVPWTPAFSYSDLDSSWRVALHYLFGSDYRFGKDVIWTFGPYGFIYTRQYFPNTFVVMVLAYVLITATIVAQIWDLLISRGTGLLVTIAVTVGLLLVLCFGARYGIIDALFYALPALFLTLYFAYPEKARGLYILTPLMALGALVKHSFAWPVFVALAVAGTSSIWLRKDTPWFLGLFVLVYASLWLLAGQSVVDLPTYVVSSLKIIGPYSETMGLGAPVTGRVVELLLFVALAASLCALLLRDIALSTWERWLFLTGLLFLLFGIFKASFVRHDTHAVIGVTFLPAFAVLCVLILPPPHQAKPDPLRYVVILLSVAAIASGGAFAFPRSYGGLPELASNARGLLRLATTRDLYARQYASLTAADPCVVDGRVDAYPYDQGPLIVAGCNYAPRPVMQSYSAYSPWLAEVNASHLEQDAKAPRYILFRVDTIDGRLPALDDGLSWPEIWSRYRFDRHAGMHDVFKRAFQARPYSLSPLATRRAQFGENLLLPDYGERLVWATLRVEKTLVGQIAALLYKVDPPAIQIRIRSGEEGIYRLLPNVSAAGFLLSPFVDSDDAFRQIAVTHRGISELCVVLVKVLPPADTISKIAYRDDVRIDLFELRFGEP